MNLLPPLPECTSCQARSDPAGIPSRVLNPGSDRPLLICLGQNPGATEAQQGTCFVGPSGHLLAEGYLRCYDLRDRFTVVLTNAARCYGPTPRIPTLKACGQYLAQDLETLRTSSPWPLTILALGAIPTRALNLLDPGLPKSLGDALEAQPIQSTVLGARIYYTLHPAACLRTESLFRAVSVHLSKITAPTEEEKDQTPTLRIVPPGPPPCSQILRTSTNSQKQTASSSSPHPRQGPASSPTT